MKKIIFLTLVVITFTFSSCRKDRDPGTLRIEFVAQYNNQSFEIGEIYEDHLGHRIRVDQFKTYVANISIKNDEGEWVEVKDIDLIDFENEHRISKTVDADSFTELRLGIGVPSDKNKDQDPNQYPNDHPLSVNGSQGMFWFWNTGYIFTKYEGKVDLEGVEGNELTDPFAFHCGEDFLYHTHSSFNNFDIESNETTTVRVVFNVEKFLQNESISINLEDDYLTHTSGNVDLAEDFMSCFNDAIEFQFE